MKALLCASVLILPLGLAASMIGGDWRRIAGAGALVPLAMSGIAMVGARVARQPRGALLRRSDAVLLLLIAVTIASIIRASAAGQLSTASASVQAIWWSAWTWFVLEARQERGLLLWLAMSVVVYSVVNMLLAAIGVAAPPNPYAETGPATVLQAVGISVNRHLFPVALGVNGFGIIAGFATTVVTVLICTGYRRILLIPLALVTAVALLLSDSRGAMVASAVTLAACGRLLLRRTRIAPRWWAAAMVALVFCGTLSAAGAAVSLNRIAAGLNLTRGGEALSGRGVMWAVSLSHFATMPALHWVFGYGLFGQASSGASDGYIRLFQHLAISDPAKVNVHSTAIQWVFDAGLLGLTALAALVRQTMQRLRSPVLGDNERVVVYSALIYMLVAGVVDLTLNPGNPILFAVLIGASAYLNYHSKVNEDADSTVNVSVPSQRRTQRALRVTGHVT